jgi:hypothetical protein
VTATFVRYMCGQLFIFIDTQVRRRNHRLLLFYVLKKDLLNLLLFVCVLLLLLLPIQPDKIISPPKEK